MSACAAPFLPFGDAPVCRDVRDEIQDEMIEAIVGQRRAGVKSTVLEAATGVGKTVVAAKVIRRGIEEWGGRFLFIVDEKELVRQTEDKFSRWGLRVGVEQAERRSRDAFALYGGHDAIVGTRQTLREQRLKGWRPDEFTDVILDECHIGVKGKSVKTIRDHLSGAAFWLGLSATPFFANGDRLVPTYFDSTAFFLPLADYADGRPGAITKGLLCPVRLIERPAGVDLRKLRTIATRFGRDYHVGDLEDALGPKIETLVNLARQEIESLRLRRVLHFSPSVRLAIEVAKAYGKVGISARAVYGDHPDAGRIIQEYHDGTFQVLSVCQMGVKGFDDPPTDGLVMMRPTKSLSLAYQMLGRGTRLSPETDKECCRVLGFAWDSGKAGPVSTLDLFMQDLDEATRKIARKLARRRDVDVQKVIEEAKETRQLELEHQRRAREDGIRLKIQKKNVKCRRREFDLNRTNSKTATPQIFAGPDLPGRPTSDQRQQLAELGLRTAPIARMSDRDAVDFIRRWDGRVEAGMSSFPQCRYLNVLGLPMDQAMNLSSKEASGAIARLKPRKQA